MHPFPPAKAKIRVFETGRGGAGGQSPTFPLKIYAQGFAHAKSPEACLLGVWNGEGHDFWEPTSTGL